MISTHCQTMNTVEEEFFHCGACVFELNIIQICSQSLNKKSRLNSRVLLVELAVERIDELTGRRARIRRRLPHGVQKRVQLLRTHLRATAFHLRVRPNDWPSCKASISKCELYTVRAASGITSRVPEWGGRVRRCSARAPSRRPRPTPAAAQPLCSWQLSAVANQLSRSFCAVFQSINLLHAALTTDRVGECECLSSQYCQGRSQRGATGHLPLPWRFGMPYVNLQI